MKLLSSSEFSLRLKSPLTEYALARSEVILCGKPTGKIITGVTLEAAIAWRDFFLAFVTDDIPLEDMLRMYLFDSDLNLVDSATLGAMYCTGSFSGLELLQPNMVRFRFIGGTTWTLELLAQDNFSLPFISDPKGVRRPVRFSRRFALHGDPMPETGD